MKLTKKISRRLFAGALSLAMVASAFSVYAPSEKAVVKAADVYGDEGSEGLNKIDKLVVESPDGKIRVQIWENQYGEFYYSAYLNNFVVLQCAPFGIVTADEDLSTDLYLDEASVKVTEGRETYDIIQGPVNKVDNPWKQLNFDLTKGNAVVTMQFRVTNEGMAYRYVVDADTTSTTEAVSVTGEDSSFMVPDSGTVWTNSWPSSTYECADWVQRSMDEIKRTGSDLSAPVLVSAGEDANNAWMLFSDASVYSNDDPYCSTVFRTNSNNKAITVKYHNYLVGEEDRSNHGTKFEAQYKPITSVDFTDKFETSWRAAIIAENINDLTSSTLIADLNPPAEGDFSWVEPGTSVWSWWSTSSDAIDYDSMFDYIDFCSTAGITYCLVDYGWEIWEDYEQKVAELVAYGNEKNVKILLWYGVHKFDNPHIFDLVYEEEIEEQFAWCEKMGVAGVKVDYINSDSKFAMKNMYLIASIAAKHHLVVNYHGCTDPNGENRTFPNILSSEAVQGMEYYKWSNGAPIPTLMLLPLSRNVIGSMEFTPALMSIVRSEATNGFMLSMCVQYESAIQTWAQSGYVYPGYEGFSLIADVPSTWDESKVISCDPMKHLIRARRNGENWYLAAMTGEANTYNVSLDFLDPDCTYYAYIYGDNEDASKIEVTTKEVTSNDTLDLALLKNGGCTIKFTKNDPIKWTEYDNFDFYEAEEATLGGNAKVESDNPYVSGKAFVSGLGNNANNSVTFENLYTEEAGTYRLKVYVVSNSKRNLIVNVNDTEYEVNDVVGIAGDGGAAGSTDYIDVALDAGYNTISLYSRSSAPAIDRIAVEKPVIDNAKVTLGTTKYVANGTPCKPSVVVERNGATLTEGKEYSLFYSNNIKAGTASVYVRGINGYGGFIKTDYTIEAPVVATQAPTQAPAVTPTIVPQTQQPAPTVAPVVSKPGKVKLSAVKSPKKKQIKVTFKKMKSVSGYQLVYSTNKKFKAAKKVTLKASAKSAVIKKLKSKKKYFVRMRAYNKDGSKKVWGAWSATKSVKVK